jgi:hypothetical protein
MYQYKVVPIGDSRELERRFGGRHVNRMERDDASIEEVLQITLDTYAEEGWKLHTCSVFHRRQAFLVLEKQT